MSLEVTVESSNPAVGSVSTPIAIKAGSDHAKTTFTPLSVGTTDISIKTPAGFTASSNSTSVKAIVQE
jgi:hypothetical protein